jgi:hypothetical protein
MLAQPTVHPFGYDWTTPSHMYMYIHASTPPPELLYYVQAFALRSAQDPKPRPVVPGIFADVKKGCKGLPVDGTEP